MSFVSAGLVKLVWQVAEQEGISRADLLTAAGLDVIAIDKGHTPITPNALEGVLRALHRRTEDPGLGLRLAEAFDLRMLGFWGYAILSCLTLRQQLELQMHYQRLFDHAGRVALRVENDAAIIEFPADGPPPPDLGIIMGDFVIALAYKESARYVNGNCSEVELSLPYPEQPHHQRLRSQVTGRLVFDAPALRVRLPATALERRLLGDPYLLELARQQLDAELTKLRRSLPIDLAGQVRQRLTAVLPDDSSLTRIARDLRLSARTLRRKLQASGESFQGILEQARHEHAVSYLVDTDHSIKEISWRLGYRDPSNFRRAFQRWTGLSPIDYRAKHRLRS